MFIGFWGVNREQETIIENEDYSIEFEGYDLNEDDEPFFNRIDHVSLTTSNLRWVPIVAYGPSRLSIQASSSSNEESKRSAKSHSLFNAEGVLLNIETELKNLLYRSGALDVKDKLGSNLRKKGGNIIQALITLLPNVYDIRVDPRADKVFFFEKDADGEPLSEKREFAELVAGSKSILAMIGDMMIRLFRQQEDATAPAELEGIVIIDELDITSIQAGKRSCPGYCQRFFQRSSLLPLPTVPFLSLERPKAVFF
jgi:hypothetical protein